MLRTWLLILPLLLIFSGCELLPHRRPVSNRADQSGLEGTLWSAHRWYDRGEEIHVRFTLRNISQEEIVLQSESGPAVDLRIADRLWSEGPGREETLRRLVLQPGEQYTIEWLTPAWREDAIYRVRGLWAIRNGEVRLTICYGVADC